MATRQQSALLRALKAVLRQKDIRLSTLTERMGASSATIKRWLAGQAITLERLEELCDIAGVTLADLVTLSQDYLDERASELTLAQERALAEDEPLSFLFFSILNDYPPSDFAEDFGFSELVMEQFFKRLVRLGLLRILPGGRIKRLASRDVTWRRGGPLARHFEVRVKRQFFSIDFGAPDTHYLSDMAKLSDAGLRRVDELAKNFRRDFHKIAEEDRAVADSAREWRTMLIATRTLGTADVNFAAPDPSD